MLRVDCKFTFPSLRFLQCEKNQYRAETSRSSYPLAGFRQPIKQARTLVIFRGLLEDPIVAHFLELLRLLEERRETEPEENPENWGILRWILLRTRTLVT